jgi:hypothetical protein
LPSSIGDAKTFSAVAPDACALSMAALFGYPRGFMPQ